MELYLFLDIDGVLNSYEHPGTDSCVKGRFLYDIDSFHVEHIQRLIKELNPKIVISSAWRQSPGLLAIIKAHNINYIDITPISYWRHREEEILAWQKEHMQPDDIGIILDDEHVLSEPRPNLIEVNTNLMSGLTGEIVSDIIKLVGVSINQKEKRKIS